MQIQAIRLAARADRNAREKFQKAQEKRSRQVILAPVFQPSTSEDTESILLELFWDAHHSRMGQSPSFDEQHCAVRLVRAVAGNLMDSGIEPQTEGSDLWWQDIPVEVLEAAAIPDIWLESWATTPDEHDLEDFLHALRRDILALGDSGILSVCTPEAAEVFGNLTLGMIERSHNLDPVGEPRWAQELAG
jgi:hypothetical protein